MNSLQSMNTCVIINPASGAGRTGKRLAKIQDVLARHLESPANCFVTSCRGEAQSAARQAGNSGCQLMIAVGGDGTIQEVVNGMMECEPDTRSACILGIINTGTGAGLARSLKLPSSIEEQFDTLAAREVRNLDIGRVNWSWEGSHLTRYFVNECQVGLGATVSAQVEHTSKRLGGFLSYGCAALKMLRKQSAAKMRVVIDGELIQNLPLLGVMVANGPRTGGGMRFAPQAMLDDGMFEAILIHEQSSVSRLRTFPRIYFGTHLSSPHVRCYHSQILELSSESPVPLAADGEPLGCLPCKIEILPSALRVCAPANRGSLK